VITCQYGLDANPGRDHEERNRDISLDGQLSAAGHARAGVRAAGACARRSAGGHALHAPANLGRSHRRAGNALSPGSLQSAVLHRSESQDSALPASSGASFRSLDCCCSHDCCCRILKTSDWAKPAVNHLSFVGLLIEPALSAPITDRVSAVLIGPDSARAPPRR